MDLLGELGVCATCGDPANGYALSCSPEHHEAMVEELEAMVGVYKKVTDTVTDISYRVPVRYIIEHGLSYEELPGFPEWED